MEVYLFVGLLGFLLVTLLGSHMIESQLEKRYQRRSLSECLPDLRK